MKENNNNKNVLLCAFLIVTAVLSRVINLEFHLLSNFACLGAISLFSGNIIKNKSYAYLIPLLAYLISDLFIAFSQGQQGPQQRVPAHHLSPAWPLRSQRTGLQKNHGSAFLRNRPQSLQ